VVGATVVGAFVVWVVVGASVVCVVVGKIVVVPPHATNINKLVANNDNISIFFMFSPLFISILLSIYSSISFNISLSSFFLDSKDSSIKSNASHTKSDS